MATSKHDFGELRCTVHGIFNGLTCPACEDNQLPDAPLRVMQERRYLPHMWWGKAWYLLEDATQLAVGDVVFDPRSYAFYAGEVKEITKLDGGNALRVVVEWFKAEDNKIISIYHTGTLEGYFLWADPALQGTK